MKMYDFRDVLYVVESFLAEHFDFYSVNLSPSSVEKLEEICDKCGIEVKDIVKNDN